MLCGKMFHSHIHWDKCPSVWDSCRISACYLKKKNLRYANSFTFGPVSPTHHSTRVHICRCRFLALLFCRANLEMLKKYSGLFELRAREAITGDNVLESWVKKYLNVSIDVKHNLGIQSTLFIQVHVPNAMYQIWVSHEILPQRSTEGLKRSGLILF